MVYITRKETFSAAHRLHRPDWPDEKNREVFGKCSNPNWHGHNYTLWVTVKGQVNPETGFVANLSEVSSVIKSHVLDKLDHKNLNLDVEFMKNKLSSTEVLAAEIFKQIREPLAAMGCTLHSVKVQETDNNYVEYFG